MLGDEELQLLRGEALRVLDRSLAAPDRDAVPTSESSSVFIGIRSAKSGEATRNS